jgi:hypothetical protein
MDVVENEEIDFKGGGGGAAAGTSGGGGGPSGGLPLARIKKVMKSDPEVKVSFERDRFVPVFPGRPRRGDRRRQRTRMRRARRGVPSTRTRAR